MLNNNLNKIKVSYCFDLINVYENYTFLKIILIIITVLVPSFSRKNGSRINGFCIKKQYNVYTHTHTHTKKHNSKRIKLKSRTNLS